MTNKIYVGFNDERVEATGDLLAEVLASQAEAKAITAKREAEAKTKAEAKAALLEKLGITEAEAKLLFA